MLMASPMFHANSTIDSLIEPSTRASTLLEIYEIFLKVIEVAKNKGADQSELISSELNTTSVKYPRSI